MEGIKKFFSLKNGWMGINNTVAVGKVEWMLSNSLFCVIFVWVDVGVERTSSTFELIVFGCVMENPKKIFSRKKDALWIIYEM